MSRCSHGGPAACLHIHLPADPGAPESLRHVPGLPAFPWVILVGDAAVVSVIEKRQHTSRSAKVPGERCPACDEVCGQCRENTGPMTQANDSFKSPGVVASPLSLQTLCLLASNTHLSRSSLQAMVDLLKRNEEPAS